MVQRVCQIRSWHLHRTSTIVAIKLIDTCGLFNAWLIRLNIEFHSQEHNQNLSKSEYRFLPWMTHTLSFPIKLFFVLCSHNSITKSTSQCSINIPCKRFVEVPVVWGYWSLLYLVRTAGPTELGDWHEKGVEPKTNQLVTPFERGAQWHRNARVNDIIVVIESSKYSLHKVLLLHSVSLLWFIAIG